MDVNSDYLSEPRLISNHKWDENGAVEPVFSSH